MRMDEGIFRDQTGLVFKETKGCTAGAAGGLMITLPGRDGIGYESFIVFLDQRPGDEGQGLHIGQGMQVTWMVTDLLIELMITWDVIEGIIYDCPHLFQLPGFD